MKTPHIRNERATRNAQPELAGRDLPHVGGVAWCGATVPTAEWLFLSADHALLSLEHNGDLAPCARCLIKLKGVLDKEMRARRIRP